MAHGKKFIVEIDVPEDTDKESFEHDLGVAVREYGRSTSEKNTLSSAEILEVHDQP
jgi:hypothetical protein